MKAYLEGVQERMGELEPVGVNGFSEEFCSKGKRKLGGNQRGTGG